jgi:Cu(I)/Ag(I) efflux system membrane fusion protein/cobalt-zinc-cadmium efflux system membrane fusion protein
MSRGMQAFSMIAFFALGVLLTWFVVANPLDVPFLPGRAVAPPAAEGPPVAADHAVYQCPMHPEVVESQPGKCPICGMPLIEVKSASSASHAKASPAEGEREILYWYAPMDPTYVRDEPGLSPMGMKLVPKYADEATGSKAGEIRIDPVRVQDIGVVSEQARTADISRYSRTVGILDFNADDITWINTKFEGWIEKVYVIYVGEHVAKGEPLFDIYSPELVTTQEEYLRALDYQASLQGSNRPGPRQQAANLVRSARDRLEYWDITDEQIDRLEQSRQVQRLLTVTSPAEGVVVEVMSEALEGMYVKPGMDLYKIADLSTVWVHADIYEIDIPWIRAGQPAVVSFRNAPQEQYRGKVLFLYPEVSRDTRTLKICVEVPNPQRRLRPGMYADVVVEGPPVENATVVPLSAVIRSGERNIVFVDLGGGRFEPREVQLGVRGERDRIQIVKGVAAGEAVVTQAQFMLDSESRIQEAIAQFRKRSKTAGKTGPAATSPDQAH